MSLIQAALNKTASSQLRPPAEPVLKAQPAVQPARVATPTARPVHAPRIWPPDLMDQKLEKELTAVQRRHDARRLLWWKMGAGLVLLLIVTVALAWQSSSGTSGVFFFMKKHPAAGAPGIKTVSVISKTQAVSPAVTGGPYQLSGIADVGDGPRAIINGRILATGEWVSRQALVKEIRRGEVVLSVNGSEVLLNLV